MALTQEQREEIGKAIRAAAKLEIVLTPKDFTVIEGDVYLDGMDPMDWVDAQGMD